MFGCFEVWYIRLVKTFMLKFLEMFCSVDQTVVKSHYTSVWIYFSLYQKIENAQEPLYQMVHYKTISDTRWFKGGPIKCLSKQKCLDYTEKWPFMVIFLYNLNIFVWIQHSCFPRWFILLTILRRWSHVGLTLCCFVVYSTRQFVLSLALCYFVLVFFSPFSSAITSLGEEWANLSAFLCICSICTCFGFVCFLFLLVSEKGCGLWLWHSLDFSLTFLG